MDKAKRKEIRKKLAEKEFETFKNSLPADESIFPQLFDYLDFQLERKGCNHTTILSQTFLDNKGLQNTDDIINWFAENGGYCDCEVLANVEGLFEYLLPPIEKPLKSKEIKKQTLNRLKTEFGFSIEKIPSPWILTETVSNKKKNYSFQLGKNKTCTVDLKRKSPLSQLENDQYWTDLWIQETKLVRNIDGLTVEREDAGQYTIVLVKSKNWIPVKIWTIDKNTKEWFLKMNTESKRYKGDLKEFKKRVKTMKVHSTQTNTTVKSIN